MHVTNRREFLQVSLAAAGAAAMTARAQGAEAPATAAASEAGFGATEILEVGPQKIRVSRMAVGTGTLGAGHSSNQLRKLGVDGVGDMLAFAYEKGLRFWDTSDGYGTHPAIKVGLKKVPRDKIAIMTKTAAVTAANLKADLERFKQELGTDYIDIVLMHSRVRGDWDTQDKPLMDVLAEAKEKKMVRSVGISVHSLDAMRTAAKCAWLDIALVRANPGNIRMDDRLEKVVPVIEELKKAGKGVIQMKVLGEGQLKNRIDEALTFALFKSPAHCFTLGCESRDEVAENISRIEKLCKAQGAKA
jgi:1-deoxyxylulose-5-phosphate synthase